VADGRPQHSITAAILYRHCVNNKCAILYLNQMQNAKTIIIINLNFIGGSPKMD
jgi:hypothetical protein